MSKRDSDYWNRKKHYTSKIINSFSWYLHNILNSNLPHILSNKCSMTVVSEVKYYTRC